MSALTGVKVIDAKGGVVERISYDGEEYLPIDEKAAVKDGDIGLTGNKHPPDDILRNSFYEMSGKPLPNSNRYRIKSDEDGDTNGLHDDYFTIFRKVSELGKRPPGYEEIPKKDARTGDYIVFTDVTDTPADVTAGEAYEISRMDSAGDPHFDDNDGCRQDMYDHRYRSHKYLRKKAALKPGDYAKVVGGSPFKRGDIVKIVEDDGTNLAPLKCTLVSEEAPDYWWKSRGNLTPATAEEVAEARRPKQPALQSGDYAEVVRKSSAMVGFHRGDTVKIIGLSAGKHTYELRNVSGSLGNEGYGNAEHLRKIPRPVTHNGRVYREVADRPAKEGEKIRIVKAEASPSEEYKNGDVFTVRRPVPNTRGGVHVREIPFYISKREYVALEPLDAADKPAADCCEKSIDDFEVGDKVRICVPEDENTSRGRAGVTNDEIGTVREINRGAGVIFVNFPSYRTFSAESQDIEKVADGPKQLAVKVTLPDGSTQNIEELDVTVEGSR
ncbi:hypothetical protein [Salibacterium lacus]|uniref:Uncharacterized protein n=1 Tax=Salibacterium lacus TaxID=1898109 RepID=A0ABW5SZS4_9BACI